MLHCKHRHGTRQDPHSLTCRRPLCTLGRGTVPGAYFRLQQISWGGDLSRCSAVARSATKPPSSGRASLRRGVSGSAVEVGVGEAQRRDMMCGA